MQYSTESDGIDSCKQGQGFAAICTGQSEWYMQALSDINVTAYSLPVNSAWDTMFAANIN